MNDLSALTKRVEELELRVASDLVRRQRTNRAALIGGGVIFCLVIGYFYFIHNLVMSVVEPKALMSIVRSKAQDFIPQGLATIQTSLQQAAPEVAKLARERAMESIPEIRKIMEQEFLSASDPYIKALKQELDALIQQGLYKNREATVEFFRDPENPKAREKYQQVVRAELKSYFDDPLVSADLKSYADLMNRLNAKFKRLRDNQNLARVEVSERDLIIGMRELARRKQ